MCSGRHVRGLVSPVGAGRNRTPNQTDFPKLGIGLPNLPEQERIAPVLNACDSDTSLLRRNLASIQN